MSATVSSPESSEQIARKAGQGFAFILAAKLYFLVAGYVIVVTLSWMLGRALYGVYGLVVGAISVLDNVIVTGTIQSVSRFTSADEARAGAIKAAALKLQLLVGGGVAVIFVLERAMDRRFRAGSVADALFASVRRGWCSATPSTRSSSARPTGCGASGPRLASTRFYATLRGLLIVGLAAAGFAVWGAVGGFVAASLSSWSSPPSVIGVRDLEGGFPAMTLVRFVVPVMIYLLAVNLVMFADLFLLKRFRRAVRRGGRPGQRARRRLRGGAAARSDHLSGSDLRDLCRLSARLAELFSGGPGGHEQLCGDHHALLVDPAVAIAVSFVALPAQVLGGPLRPSNIRSAPTLWLCSPPGTSPSRSSSSARRSSTPPVGRGWRCPSPAPCWWSR